MHRPISYRFRDKRRFQLKITKFSHPVYLTPPLKGFVPLQLGIGAWSKKKLAWWGYRAENNKFNNIFSIYIQYTNMADGRTDTGRQQRPRVRIASRGKNDNKDRFKFQLGINPSPQQFNTASASSHAGRLCSDAIVRTRSKHKYVKLGKWQSINDSHKTKHLIKLNFTTRM